MSVFLFDLDGVILHTTVLNNKSYNYSLVKHNFNKIDSKQRITRKTVKKYFPNIDEDIMQSIVNAKQKFFITHIHEVVIDKGVMELVKALKKEQCYIWTGADYKRARHLIDTFNLLSYFNDAFFLAKDSLGHDLELICKTLSLLPSNLYVFEDDSDNCMELSQYGIRCFLYLTHVSQL